MNQCAQSEPLTPPGRLQTVLRGIMLGTATGDSVGLPAEGLSRRRIKLRWNGEWRQRFILGRGMCSDDTEHTFLAAQALLSHPDDPAAFQKCLAWKLRLWLLGLPAGVGLGTSFVECTLEADPGVVNISLAGANGTAGGLSSWAFCKIDTNAYVNPSSALWTTYNFWQYENTDLLGGPVSFSGLQTLTNADPRLVAATNATTWLYGWTPRLAPNILADPASQTVNAGDPVTLAVSATGIPAPTYQWLKNGTNLAGATGETLVIAVAHVADGGTYSVVVTTPAGSATSAAATLTVNPHPNTAGPVFTAPAAGTLYTINVGVNLSVTNTATDADVPAETIAFSRLSGSGSVTADGIFTWRPQVGDAGTTNEVTLKVTDDGVPSQRATNTFTVRVNPLNQPNVSSAAVVGGLFTLTVTGDVGPDYAVEASTDLTTWNGLFITNSPPSPFSWTDNDAGSFQMRFYRLRVGPPFP